MSVIETTGVLEGRERLHLAEPVPEGVSGTVRVIVLIEENGDAGSGAKRPDFLGAIGSYYRDYPDEPRRDSAAWLKELREGESE